MYYNCPKCGNSVMTDILGDNMSEWQGFHFECDKCGTNFNVEIDVRRVIIEEPELL